MDYNDSVESNIKTMEKMLDITKGEKLIIAMDSNSRSTTWYDVTTNSRRKLLEEFVASN
jgi:chlorite dismutase